MSARNRTHFRGARCGRSRATENAPCTSASTCRRSGRTACAACPGLLRSRSPTIMPSSGIAGLQRRMDHVAGDDGVLPGLADLHRVVVDRVAGRRDELHQVVQRVVALHDVGALGRDDRQHRVGDPRAGSPGPPSAAASSAPARGRRTGTCALGKVGTQRPFSSRVFQPTWSACRCVHITKSMSSTLSAGRRQALLVAVAVHHVPERPRRPRLVIADAGSRSGWCGAACARCSSGCRGSSLPVGIEVPRLQPGAVFVEHFLASAWGRTRSASKNGASCSTT